MSNEILQSGLPKHTAVIAYVQDDGDPSVGIFAQTWEVVCPFWAEDAEQEDYTCFKETLTELYSGYCEGRVHVYFNTDHTCYIDFLNKDNNFKQERKTFTCYGIAFTWGKENLEKFDSDMIHYL